jgi:PAS domain S-box-containing protein
MTDPIVKISQVASQVAQGDFEGKVDDTFSRDEISFLSKTFNQMIQDLKKQRAQLVDKDYVDSIIASMIDTLVVIDPDGIIKTVNKATCDLLNYREEELIGKPITTIFAEPESEALSSKTDELIRQGFIGNFEKTLLAKDGRRITVSFLGSVMRDHQGTIEGIICIARDLTERKWAEEKMRQQNEYLTALNNELEKTLEQLKATQNRLITQEKLASLGALTAGIAHELKNPLNFVNNFAKFSIELTEELREDLSSQKDRLDSEVFVNIEGTLNDLEQFTKKINDHGKRADSIIRNMLLHSRGKPGEKQLVDINALLSEYVDLVYHGMRAKDTTFNTKIEKDYDPSIGMVEVVPQNLGRVFLNIINNACYAIHKKAKEIKEEFSPTLWLRTKNLGKQVEICIYDNGDGIPKAIIDKIFNPFFTTKPAGDGTGLGLSISYDIIVHEHKGEIRVETEEGSYAKFIIVLPK